MSIAETWKVLFCGKMMRAGFQLTKKLVDSNIIACSDTLSIEECDHSELNEAIKDAHVAIPLMSRIDHSLIQRAEKLKLILQFGVGVEGIDMAAASKRGIAVSNIPSDGTGNALSCAEHALFLMLSLLRDMPRCQAAFQKRLLGEPCGETLFGKRVLVLGYGNIARELIPRLVPLGVQISCVRRSPWLPEDKADARGVVAFGTAADLPRMLPAADIIAVTASQTPESRGLVGREFLRHCRDGVRIVNVARGGLLDREACWEALQSGRVGGMGLDVQWQEPFDPQDPFARDPRVIMTPHVAGVTKLSYESMARVVVQEALRVRRGCGPAVWLNRNQMCG